MKVKHIKGFESNEMTIKLCILGVFHHFLHHKINTPFSSLVRAMIILSKLTRANSMGLIVTPINALGVTVTAKKITIAKGYGPIAAASRTVFDT